MIPAETEAWTNELWDALLAMVDAFDVEGDGDGDLQTSAIVQARGALGSMEPEAAADPSEAVSRAVDEEGDLWAALLEWAQRLDDRNISDHAHRWADTEAGAVARPENDGEWKASMAAAFDAGRRWAELVRARKGGR